MALTNAERQRRWRERRAEKRDKAIWQSWCARTGHDPNDQNLSDLVTADIQERHLKAALQRVRRAIEKAREWGATEEEIWDCCFPKRHRDGPFFNVKMRRTK